MLLFIKLLFVALLALLPAQSFASRYVRYGVVILCEKTWYHDDPAVRLLTSKKRTRHWLHERSLFSEKGLREAAERALGEEPCCSMAKSEGRLGGIDYARRVFDHMWWLRGGHGPEEIWRPRNILRKHNYSHTLSCVLWFSTTFSNFLLFFSSVAWDSTHIFLSFAFRSKQR